MIRTDGVDFVDKVNRIYKTNLVDNTNIQAVFDLLLNIARKSGVKAEDIPQNIIIISDMEFDEAQRGWYGNRSVFGGSDMEYVMKQWAGYGLKAPNLVFWNVCARQNNIPMAVRDGISYVSGFSPSIFEQIMSGKTAFDLMYEVLDRDRYSVIH